MPQNSKRKTPVWLIVLGIILLILIVGALVVYRMVSVKKKEISHYGIKSVHITESSIAQGKVTYDGYAVLNTSLPEGISPDKVKITTVWDRSLTVKTEFKKPKRTDAKVDTLFFAMSNDLSDFLDELRRQQKKDSSLMEGTIRIEGNVPGKDDGEPIVLKFSKKVRHFKFPIVLLGKPDIKYQGLKKAHIKLGIEIRNLDRYYLSLRNIYAKIKLGKDAEAELKNEPDMLVKPYQTKHYTVGLDVDIHKPGKVISKVITNKDTYILEQYLKVTVGIGKPDNEKFNLKDNSVWQDFPIVLNQQDTMELMPKKGEDRFAPGKPKPKE